MFKKILSVVFAALLVMGILAACSEKPVTSNDSSVVASTEDVSSEKEEASSSSKKESSSNKTQSVSSKKQDKDEEETETSSKKGAIRPGEEEEEETSSETESTSIKVFKNNNTVQINCYHFGINNCKAFGENANEDDKFAEFKAVVEAGYFNSYLLGMGSNLVKEVPVIAENGGTFWCFAPKFAANASGVDYSIDAYIEECKFYIDWMKKNGYYELFNGFHWDEPAPNDNFLKLTERLYKEFGLRQYPVFACSQFMDYEGNKGEAGFVDMSGILNPKTGKYITDVGYDSYSTDVREGAPNGGKYKDWQKEISPNVVDGKSYYIEIRKILQKQMGRPANFWHYATAYRNYLWGGLNGVMYADEPYVTANLEFLVEDLMAQECQGGITLYTFANFHGGHTGFECFCDAKVNGQPLCNEREKWNSYCNLLRETRKKFDKTKANLAKIIY